MNYFSPIFVTDVFSLVEQKRYGTSLGGQEVVLASFSCGGQEELTPGRICLAGHKDVPASQELGASLHPRSPATLTQLLWGFLT